MAFIMRRYIVAVDGYCDWHCEASSPGKARAKAWREWVDVFGKGITFHDFLCRSSVRRDPTPPRGFGRRVLVSGAPAYALSWPSDGYRVRFVEDDSDVIHNSHPADVSEAA
ncbi:hypothetical protein [Rhizobium ruizarguesonis]|uniref:hypothetical protein n=1 Tax=Rhizobium ruizarguesonis TaxID=2081791 RepID=UPI001031ACE9|nr:hypothetical protein [Rhizobium ruizarguesonis]TAY95834.1 hypothetical protein ELH85_22795 [Rhizobium ruizarguesonis]